MAHFAEPTAAAPTSAADPRRHHVLRLLWPYLWRHRGRILLTLILLLCARLANVGVPVVFKNVVDAMAPGAPLLGVPLLLLAAYGALRLGSAVLSEVRTVVFGPVMYRTARRVALEVFEHLHALSMRFHLGRQTGAVARDMERGKEGIVDLLDWSVYSIVPTTIELLIILGYLLLHYSPWFTVVTLLTLVLYVWWTFAITAWRTHFYRRMNEANSAANAMAVDSLLNYETVKYFGNERYEAERYDRSLAEHERAARRSSMSLGLLNVGQNLIITAGLVVLMWLAARGVVAGSMSLGDLVLVNAMLLLLAQPLNMLGMIYREVRQALTNMEQLFALLEQAPEVHDRPDARPLERGQRPLGIRFRQVDFAYDARRQVLHQVDFEIPPGRTVAIVGPSGSGKSTLSRLLFRFYDVGAGAIEIDGTDLRALTQTSLRAAIGIVPQDTVLFNESIEFNIRYGRPDATRAEVIAAARAAHIHDFIDSLPDGYETVVGERGLKLSGGEKQRVAIARALLKNPSVLVFDEATSALDSNSERAIQEELDRIAVGRTTMVIAHRLSTVMHADRILVLDRGRIVEQGTHAELLAQGGRYAEMWAMQQEAALDSVSSGG